MTERKNREPIEWEDTLSKTERMYTEKIAAQKETIQALKKAKEENTLNGYLNALTLGNMPSEFHHVKKEFVETICAFLKDEANLNQVSVNTLGETDRLHLKLDGLYGTLLTVSLKKRELTFREGDWITLFTRWRDPERNAVNEDWLNKRLQKLRMSRTGEEEDNLREIQVIETELSQLKELEQKWVSAKKAPSLKGVIQEFLNVIELLKKEGFTVRKVGMEPKTHYMLKTPFRWEEDHTKGLSKFQKRFARPVNKPTRDQQNTHYGGGMLEYPLGTVLALVRHSNENTREWYERRMLGNEWLMLNDLYKTEGFSVRRDETNGLEVTHLESGNVATFYSNGHIWVTIPEGADETLVTSYVGILPFLSHPAFRTLRKELIKNTFHEPY